MQIQLLKQNAKHTENTGIKLKRTFPSELLLLSTKLNDVRVCPFRHSTSYNAQYNVVLDLGHSSGKVLNNFAQDSFLL
jgi:hypothetical protein